MNSDRNIHFLLLDLGDVLIEIDWLQMQQRLGIAAEVLDEIRSSSEHDAFERGQLAAADFYNHINKKINRAFDHEYLEAAWCSILSREVLGVTEALQKIKKDHQKKHQKNLSIYVLSNTNKPHVSCVLKNKARYPFLTCVDSVLTSYELGCRKPEREIYLKAIEIMRASADEVIFFDDKIENVQAARDVGLNAKLCYRDPQIFLRSFEG